MLSPHIFVRALSWKGKPAYRLEMYALHGNPHGSEGEEGGEALLLPGRLDGMTQG